MPLAVETDVVAHDLVAGGGGLVYPDILIDVAGNDVALGGVVDAVGIRADAVVARAVADPDAALVGSPRIPGQVGANIIAVYPVVPAGLQADACRNEPPIKPLITSPRTVLPPAVMFRPITLLPARAPFSSISGGPL